MVDFTLFKTPIQSKFFLVFSILAVLSVSARANAIENKVKTVTQWVTPLQNLSQPVVKKNYQHIPNHFKEFVVCCSSTGSNTQSSIEKEQTSSTKKESENRIVASANSIPFNTPTLKIPIINKQHYSMQPNSSSISIRFGTMLSHLKHYKTTNNKLNYKI